MSSSSGALGFDLRSYLLASLVGRGGKYALKATIAPALGETARSLSKPEFYLIVGIATLLVLAAYFFRHRWLPDDWLALGE